MGEFTVPNNNADKGRRNSLSNRASEAANLVAEGDIQGAIDKLTSLHWVRPFVEVKTLWHPKAP